MKPTLLIYKQPGETPLQAINRVKRYYPTLEKTKVSMAGRLDPMAEGLLLLLIGDENKKRSLYESYYKAYEFSVIFGIETDSYDGLGMIKAFNIHCSLNSQSINNLLLSFTGSVQQPYPPFSSKPYKGKPLYYWSRKEIVDEKDLPRKDVTVSELSLLSLETVPLKNIAKNILTRIISIQGDFRQKEISSQWENVILNNGSAKVFLAHFKIRCSSGTYVRGIAHALGKQLKTGAFAYSIKRTQIGPYTELDIERSLKGESLL